MRDLVWPPKGGKISSADFVNIPKFLPSNPEVTEHREAESEARTYRTSTHTPAAHTCPQDWLTKAEIQYVSKKKKLRFSEKISTRLEMQAGQLVQAHLPEQNEGISLEDRKGNTPSARPTNS